MCTHWETDDINDRGGTDGERVIIFFKTSALRRRVPKRSKGGCVCRPLYHYEYSCRGRGLRLGRRASAVSAQTADAVQIAAHGGDGHTRGGARLAVNLSRDVQPVSSSPAISATRLIIPERDQSGDEPCCAILDLCPSSAPILLSTGPTTALDTPPPLPCLRHALFPHHPTKR